MDASLDNERDVIVLSAFGRGLWLSQELAQMGLKVDFVDVTSRMGKWKPQDIEGPFGLFASTTLPHTYASVLSEQETQTEVERGLTLWLPSGPFELRGPLYEHQLKSLALDPSGLQYLRDLTNLSFEERTKWPRKNSRVSFSHNWLVYFAHHIASSRYQNHSEDLKESEPLPVFANLYQRRVTPMGVTNGLKWAETRGIRVFREAHVVDLQALVGKQIGMEIQQNEKTIVVKAKHLVWGLSCLDTAFAMNPLYERIFRTRVPELHEPEWGWFRFRLKFDESSAELVPSSFVVVEDPHRSWTHTNIVWYNRVDFSCSFDGWLRLPIHQRFHRTYLEDQARRLCEVMERKLPMSQVVCEEYPAEYYESEDVLGPPRFPVFSPSLPRSIELRASQAFSLMGPDLRQRLDWTASYELELRTLREVVSKLSRENPLLKQGGRLDSTIHP